MTSLELVGIINEVRKRSGKPDILHKNLIKKIEGHPSIHSAKFSAEYTDSTGRALKMYKLPKRECDLMVMSESLAIQGQVYDRLKQAYEMLEGKQRMELAKTLEAQLRYELSDEASVRRGASLEYTLGCELVKLARRHRDKDNNVKAITASNGMKPIVGAAVIRSIEMESRLAGPEIELSSISLDELARADAEFERKYAVDLARARS